MAKIWIDFIELFQKTIRNKNITTNFNPNLLNFKKFNLKLDK